MANYVTLSVSEIYRVEQESPDTVLLLLDIEFQVTFAPLCITSMVGWFHPFICHEGP